MSSPKRRRKLPHILTRDGYRCTLCGCPLTTETATLDHIIPEGVGGRDSNDNLRAACKPCNFERGRKDEAEIVRLVREIDMREGRMGPFRDPKEVRAEAKKILAKAREVWPCQFQNCPQPGDTLTTSPDDSIAD